MASSKIFVVDTNVMLVANGQHKNVSDQCLLCCIEILEKIQKHGVIAIDNSYAILGEYEKNISQSKGNQVGYAFFMWLRQNTKSAKYVHSVQIERHDELEYSNFPDDKALNDFDRADRKFVAVSIAHGEQPPIAQATDSKWLSWVGPLSQYGVRVEFLCQDDVDRFIKRKDK